MTLDQVLVHVQRSLAVLARQIPFLQLQVAECAVREVRRVLRVLYLEGQKTKQRLCYKLDFDVTTICSID